jgi:hypothetical protein
MGVVPSVGSPGAAEKTGWVSLPVKSVEDAALFVDQIIYLFCEITASLVGIFQCHRDRLERKDVKRSLITAAIGEP